MGVLADFKASLAEKLDVFVTNASNATKKPFVNKVKARGNAQVHQTINIIDIGSASKDDREEAAKLLRSKFERGELLFVTEDAKQLVEAVQISEEANGTKNTVDYFENKLKPVDWQILRTGLYISQIVESGEKGQAERTSRIRKDVIVSYGERGKNLLNLAAGGHFETHIRPLYEELAAAPGFSQAVFYEEFDRILEEMPFAIFVNSECSAEQLIDKINNRIASAKHYSVNKRQIFIHGWGHNVSTVEEALKSIDPDISVSSNKRKKVVEIIDVTLEF